MTTLDALFQWMLAASLRASLLTFAVLALQVALRSWLPPRWRYALWLPVVLVLMAPALPPSPLSVENGFAVASSAEPIASDRSGHGATMPFEPTPASDPAAWRPTWTEALIFTWLSGAAMTLGLGLLGYRQSVRRVRRGAIVTSPEVARAAVEEARRLALRRLPEVIVSQAVESPAVAGLFRPLLLLPANFLVTFSDAEARLILRHEFTHLARRDLPVNWLLCLLQVAHWFNPVLWFAFSRIRADREAACDAQVLAREEEDVRGLYGHALLKLQSRVAAPGLSLAFVGILERSAGMRARLLAIAAHRRSHPAWGWAVAMLIAGLTLLGATRAQTNAPVAPAGGSANIEVSSTFIGYPPGYNPVFASESMVVDRGMTSAIITREDLVKLLNYPKANLLSAPKVSVLDGQKARIEVVRDVIAPDGPGQTATTTKPSGVTLDVTPKIVDGGVSLDLKATVATLKDKKTGAVVTDPPSDWTKVDYLEDRLSSTVTIPADRAVVMLKVDPKKKNDTLLVVVTPNGMSPMRAAAQRIILKEPRSRPGTIGQYLDEIRSLSIASDPAGKGVMVTNNLPAATLDQQVTIAMKGQSVEAVLEAIAKAAKADLTWPMWTASLSPARAAKPASAPAATTPSAAQQRAQAIILKQLSLQAVSFDESLKIIRDLALKADPEKKGVKITVSGATPEPVTVNMLLKEIPVADALNYVARLSGMDLSWSDEGAVFTPPQPKARGGN